MEKQDKILKILQEANKQADALTATQAKELVELLVKLTTKQKEDIISKNEDFLSTVSQETYSQIQEALLVLREKANDNQLEVRQLSNKAKKEHEERMSELDVLIAEFRAFEIPEPQEIDKEGIINETLSRIPKVEIPTETGDSVIKKINKSEKKIKRERVEGLDKVIDQEGLDRALGVLDQRTQYLINKRSGGGQVDSVVAGTNITVDNTDPANPIISSTGGGSGTVTSVDATVPTGLTISGSPITTSGTLVFDLDTGYVIPLQSTIDGKQATLVSGTNIKTINGTSLLGSGDVTISGVGTATANEIAYWDTTTSIASLTTATYPSLTELSYVKGVTSAIQTQLDGKIDGTMVLNRIPYGSDSNTLQTSANLIFDGNQLIVETDSSGVIPAIIRSSTSAQTASLLEVRRYDASPGLTVGADTQVTLGGAYDYVNAKHATQHILRYSSSGVYSGKALKLSDLYTGSTTRLHSFNNGLYITDDTGTATPLVLGIWANPSDGTHFSTNTGQWRIESGKLVVNRNTWSGVAQLESSSTTLPQLAGFYDTSNYLTVTTGSTGSTTFALTGTSPTFTFSQNVTLPTLTTTGNIELGHASDTTLSRSSAGVLAVEGVVIPSISSTNTLTNKRITKRTGTTTSSATPTINTDNVDFYSLTAQAVDITSFTTNLSGTPTEGQTLWIAITGTAARAITWGSSFEASTVALPTTTVTTNRLDVGFVWNTVTSKWRCVASA